MTKTINHCLFINGRLTWNNALHHRLGLKSIPTLNLKVRINTMKNQVLSWWYRSPDVRCSIIPATSDCCWRCRRHRGTYFRMLCALTCKFSIGKSFFFFFLNQMMSKLCTPETALLSLFPGPLKFLKGTYLDTFTQQRL